jgi:hypothetical protein
VRFQATVDSILQIQKMLQDMVDRTGAFLLSCAQETIPTQVPLLRKTIPSPLVAKCSPVTTPQGHNTLSDARDRAHASCKWLGAIYWGTASCAHLPGRGGLCTYRPGYQSPESLGDLVKATTTLGLSSPR